MLTLLSTARSNKVSICLGLQELPQLEEQYGKATAKTITSIIGNTLSGQAKAPETLDWLQKLFGKVKQVKEGVTIRRNETTINMNEQVDFVIPASKISSTPTRKTSTGGPTAIGLHLWPVATPQLVRRCEDQLLTVCRKLRRLLLRRTGNIVVAHPD